ncbi:MAG: hypothetical protein EBR30_20620 [Cytophagia bacterium]|nr:hypothetical protein [Cytophagia bacterium]
MIIRRATVNPKMTLYLKDQPHDFFNPENRLKQKKIMRKLFDILLLTELVYLVTGLLVYR